MCLDGYISIGTDCFKLSSSKLTWNEAQRKCQEQGDQLAVPKELNDFTEYFLNQKWHGKYFLVGGRREPGGIWKWMDGRNKEFDARYWAEDNPTYTDSTEFVSPRCLAIRFGDRGFVDYLCSFNDHYICQKNTLDIDDEQARSNIINEEPCGTTFNNIIVAAILILLF
ncbi:unnamed protein product [Meganyctiphanes norvegica]|uniref:C-type lectin domain-containing protein n=1 Tax=Meganyctiphanes norvegica TaxID=48144 RepID=A0AAV2RBV0_MEGNR